MKKREREKKERKIKERIGRDKEWIFLDKKKMKK